MGHHLPPIMVLLTSSVRPANAQPLKLQALEAWRALVKALAKHSPSQLSDVANQVTDPQSNPFTSLLSCKLYRVDHKWERMHQHIVLKHSLNVKAQIQNDNDHVLTIVVIVCR